ncbi:hypothetical protein ACOMHN_043656 [Nucella lapillus]
MARSLILFCFLCVTVVMTSAYVHMDDPCPADEQCPLHPDAQCIFDCMIVDANGNGQDCIYNWYENGQQVGCYA